MDIVYVVAAGACFALSWALVRMCGSLGGEGSVDR